MHSKIQIEIHERALEIVGCFKRAEADLIDILQKADEHRVYLRFECKNLHEYTMKVLKLTESIAFNFIVVARKAQEVPQLKEVIESGALSVSKARKITPVLTSANQERRLQMAVELPQRKLEQEVARVLPKEATPEKLKFISGERLSLQMGLSEGLSRKLRHAQNLESRKRKRPATLEETLEALIESYLERHDPVKKAERIQHKEKKPAAARQPKENASAPNKSAIRHQVNLRDKGRCTHIGPQGERCSEQRWIHMHHIVPRHAGGPDTVDNLTTLCSGHHRLIHSQ